MSTGWVRSEMSDDQLRQAVMPMIDSYLRIMRGAARLETAERAAIHDACEAEFRIRLDNFAGEQGYFGEDRAFLNEFVASTFDNRAVATEPVSQGRAASQPAAASQSRHRWWGLLIAAAAGALLVMR